MRRTAEEVLAGWWCQGQMDLLEPESAATPPPAPPKPPRKPPRPRPPSPGSSTPGRLSPSWTCPDQMEIE